MTRAEIRNLARKRLGETTAAFWTDAELNLWVNDGMRDIAYRTKCLRSNSLASPTNAVSEYVLSTLFPNATSISEVYFYGSSSTWSKLIPTSKTELDEQFPEWMSASSVTDPTHYWWDREDDIFYLYPAVTTAVADTIKAYYTLDSTDLSGDSETPTIPEHLHLAIVDFVVASGFDTRGWTEKANDAWAKCYQRLTDYRVERHREREDDNIISRNYRR